MNMAPYTEAAEYCWFEDHFQQNFYGTPGWRQMTSISSQTRMYLMRTWTVSADATERPWRVIPTTAKSDGASC